MQNKNALNASQIWINNTLVIFCHSGRMQTELTENIVWKLRWEKRRYNELLRGFNNH